MAIDDNRAAGLWLNLSGGGFRAAIFHYGCVRRLHEAALLSRLVGISATSGGSIVAGLWAMHFERSFRTRLGEPGWREQSPTRRRAEVFEAAAVAAWPRFESDFVELVRNGLLKQTALLVAAASLYLLAGVLLAVRLLADPAEGLMIATVCVFAAGVALHVGLAVSLLSAGALRRDTWAFAPHPDVTFRARLSLFAKALLSPSRLRWYTMDLFAFHGYPFMWLKQPLFRVFFNAVNLEAGRQAVLSPLLESGLDDPDLDTQWKARPDEDFDWRIAPATPLSRAVAASTAFPPWFAPVPIDMVRRRDGRERRTCRFVDGGVTDNAGFKLSRGLSGWGHPPPPTGDRHQASFKEEVRLVLTLDASRSPRVEARVATRLRAALRLAQVAQNAQVNDLDAATNSLRDIGYIAWAAGLQTGFQEEPLSTLNSSLTSVRTHLDGFTTDEIGALGYCGYMRMEYMITGGHLGVLQPDDSSPAMGLAEFMEEMGIPPRSVEELAAGFAGVPASGRSGGGRGVARRDAVDASLSGPARVVQQGRRRRVVFPQALAARFIGRKPQRVVRPGRCGRCELREM
jgi:hypothetical protein